MAPSRSTPKEPMILDLQAEQKLKHASFISIVEKRLLRLPKHGRNQYKYKGNHKGQANSNKGTLWDAVDATHTMYPKTTLLIQT